MSTALAQYENICRAVAECRTADQAKGIRDHAEAMRVYARQARNRDLELDAWEIRERAEARLGEIIKAQKETVGLATGGDAMKARYHPGTEVRPTLADAGIDKKLSSRAQKKAAVPEAERERRIAEAREKAATSNRPVHRVYFNGDNEWYTPEEHIDLAREVMGAIDLDPASNAIAQEVVRAERFYTKEDDGLKHPWHGRIWLNPPYSQPEIEHFVDKLIAEHQAGRTSEAILLTNNYTDTVWFHKAVQAMAAICFTRGRIRFRSPRGELASPTQGQAFFYFGADAERFVSTFQHWGFVCVSPTQRPAGRGRVEIATGERQQAQRIGGLPLDVNADAA